MRDLDEIEKACAEATPGPWIPKHSKTFYASGETEHEVRSRETGTTVATIRFHASCAELGADVQDMDAAFIAGARSWVPTLVAELRATRAEVERLAGLLTRLLVTGDYVSHAEHCEYPKTSVVCDCGLQRLENEAAASLAPPTTGDGKG